MRSFFLHRIQKTDDGYFLPNYSKNVKVYINEDFIGIARGYEVVFWNNFLYTKWDLVIDKDYKQHKENDFYIFIKGTGAGSSRGLFLNHVTIEKAKSLSYPDNTVPFEYKISRYPYFTYFGEFRTE
jgi:hypothetical protein